jgi:hypothetical protein
MLHHHSPQRKKNGGTHLFYGLPDLISLTSSFTTEEGKWWHTSLLWIARLDTFNEF